MTAIPEIRAHRRDVPRYCPGHRLPAYRYVPGLHPHPSRDPDGHSFGQTEPFGDHSGWRAQDWERLTPWLCGVDLFNRFYFWEAHEAWESLWGKADRKSDRGLLLQGLIQIAAALLKVHLGSIAGASRLSHSGIEKLNLVAARVPTLLGLDLRRTANEMHTYFCPLASGVLPKLDDDVPSLRLAPCRTSGECPSC